MVTTAETNAGQQLYGALRQGLENLDLNQKIHFQAYTRAVLPVDGYIFWAPQKIVTVKGSLHYSQEIVQNEEETYGMGTFVFTSEEAVTIFENSPTDTIYVGATEKGTRYAFFQQQGFYSQAGIWHYFGHSIAPAMLTQLLDTPTTIDLSRAVTSNSMALWLKLNNYSTPYADWFTNDIPLYPAKLVTANLQAPYIAVDIQGTRALQARTSLRQSRSSHQLVADRVRLIAYGLQSDECIDFLNCLYQYSELYEYIGIMSTPVWTDEKREFPGIEAIAMKKTLDIEVSYIQSRVEEVARTLIKQCHPTFIVGAAVNLVTQLGTQSGFGFTTQGGQAIQSQ
jgi:hypothetical protein